MLHMKRVPQVVFIGGYPRERFRSGSGAGFPHDSRPRVPSHRAGSVAFRVPAFTLLSPFELSMKGTPAIE